MNAYPGNPERQRRPRSYRRRGNFTSSCCSEGRRFGARAGRFLTAVQARSSSRTQYKATAVHTNTPQIINICSMALQSSANVV